MIRIQSRNNQTSRFMHQSATRRQSPRAILLPNVQKRTRRTAFVPGLIWDPVPPCETLDPIGLLPADNSAGRNLED